MDDGTTESMDAREVLRREAEANRELWTEHDEFGERILRADDDSMFDDELDATSEPLDDDLATAPAMGSDMRTAADEDGLEDAFHETLVSDTVVDQIDDPNLAENEGDLTAADGEKSQKDESFGEKIRDKARELRDKL